MYETLRSITAASIRQSISDFRLSDLLVLEIIIPIIIVILIPVTSSVLDHIFFRYEESKRRKNHDHTRQHLLRSLMLASVYTIGFVLLFYSIPPLRAISVGMFAGVGILGIIVGLAAQDSLSNIMAGINLALFRPFRLGDRLSIQDEDGTVEDITLRHTIIKTWDNKHVIIPNQIIGKEMVINHSIIDKRSLNYVDVEVSYDSDIDKVREVMLDEAKKHPDFGNVRLSKDEAEGNPRVRVRNLRESGIEMRLYFWSKDRATGRVMRYDVQESLIKRFRKEKIEIPYPHRTIIHKYEKNNGTVDSPEKEE